MGIFCFVFPGHGTSAVLAEKANDMLSSDPSRRFLNLWVWGPNDVQPESGTPCLSLTDHQ